MPAESGEVDDTGVDEAIVPTDMNLLTGSLPQTFRVPSIVLGLCRGDYGK